MEKITHGTSVFLTVKKSHLKEEFELYMICNMKSNHLKTIIMTTQQIFKKTMFCFPCACNVPFDYQCGTMFHGNLTYQHYPMS